MKKCGRLVFLSVFSLCVFSVYVPCLVAMQEYKVAKVSQWVTSDFECLARSFPSLSSCSVEDSLVLVDYVIGPRLCFVFMCPQLIVATFEKLMNRQFLKLCADGTYRMVKDQYVVISAGLLSKVFGRKANPGEPFEGYKSQFNEMILAISDVEAGDAYTMVFSSLVRSVQHLLGEVPCSPSVR